MMKLDVPTRLNDVTLKMKEEMVKNGNPYVSKVDLLDALAMSLERNMKRWEKDLEELLTVPGADFGSRSRKKRPFF